MKTTRHLCIVILAASGLALAACAGPVSAVRVDPKVVQADLARSAVTTGEPSWATRNVLYEQGLFEAFGERPEEALAALHGTMRRTGGDPDLLFALAELAFLHGQAAAKPEYKLAAAVYSYAFLFPGPGRFDPRLRLAADRLRYFGHWITPVGSPRRYDTRFFIAVAPEGQDVRHDNREAIAHAWVRPREALELCARETINLRLPTIRTLERFAACATTGELMSEVESAREVRAQLPRITRDGRSVLPGEPGYDDAGSVER